MPTRLEGVTEDFLKSFDSTSQINLEILRQIENIQLLLLFPDVVDQ